MSCLHHLWPFGPVADTPHGHDHGGSTRGAAPSAPAEDPLTVLKRRLAAGEISLEDYERIRAALAAS